jgi:hypothetical protein
MRKKLNGARWIYVKVKRSTQNNRYLLFCNFGVFKFQKAWALKRGYLTAKASRPDTYRAANELLRMALDGRLCLSLRPRNYTSELDKWNNHESTKQLNEVIESVEAMAKVNKSNKKPEIVDSYEEDYSDNEANGNYGESDSYKDFKHKLESTDEKEKKDTEDSTDVDTNANFYRVLANNE